MFIYERKLKILIALSYWNDLELAFEFMDFQACKQQIKIGENSGYICNYMAPVEAIYGNL